MDSLPKAKRKNEKTTDSEKLAKAIKKAKYERARKAVNDSFDHSIGSLRKRRQRKQAALNQSFALKQAATLQKKNKEIVSELAKSRQYSTKLEKVNFYFKQQQMAMAMRIASLERKMKNLYEENINLKQSKNDFLATLTSQLTATLDSVDAFKMGQNDLPSVENVTSRKQPKRVIRQASSKRVSRVNSQLSLGSVQAANNLARSPSPPDILTPVIEECNDGASDYDNSGEDNSFVEVAEDPLNDASAKLDISESADSSDTESDDSEKVTEKVNLHSDNLDYDKAENVTNHDTVSMELTEADANESTGSQQNDLSGNTTENDPSSHDNEIAGVKGSGVIIETVEKSPQMSSNTLENESIELTSTEVSVVIAQHSKSKKTEVEKNKNVAEVQASGVTIETVEKSPRISSNTFENESSESTKSTEVSVVLTQRTKAHAKSKKTEVKKKKKKTPCFDAANKSVFDFLSKSSDSFVSDSEKRIKLNCTKSLSPEKLPTKNQTKHRFSQPVAGTNDENTPPRRRRRAAGAVSYAEPPLNSKLRRGDRIADDTLVKSFTPKRKSKKKFKGSRVQDI